MFGIILVIVIDLYVRGSLGVSGFFLLFIRVLFWDI